RLPLPEVIEACADKRSLQSTLCVASLISQAADCPARGRFPEQPLCYSRSALTSAPWTPEVRGTFRGGFVYAPHQKQDRFMPAQRNHSRSRLQCSSSNALSETAKSGAGRAGRSRKRTRLGQSVAG